MTANCCSLAAMKQLSQLSSANPAAARQLIEWCLETGAGEAIGEFPQNRYQRPMKEPPSDPPETAGHPVRGTAPMADETMTAGPDQAAAAEAAAAATSLRELRDAIAQYPHCDLREHAHNLVFSDGNPAARVMVVGEAPGADEDRQGKPFVGRAGRLLDLMFAEIGLDRENQLPDNSLYITNVLPWRPPGNRNPSAREVEMMQPFVFRHIELAGPEILVAMGNFSCSLLIGQTGVTRLRGNWFAFRNIPVMPMFHPAYLLRNPVKKGDSWHDLLMIRSRLGECG